MLQYFKAQHGCANKFIKILFTCCLRSSYGYFDTLISLLFQAANKNKVQDDVEAGANKQNGLKLTIPSISATVETESKSTENSNSTGNSTSPNTTSTPLSRRHASEDTTLDYAYDNPAMTPSPETVQTRTKARESAF